MVLLTNVLQGKVLVDARGNGAQKVHLIFCQWFHSLDKQHVVDSQQVVEAADNLLVGDDTALFGLGVDDPSQLLHIGRIAVYQRGNACRLVFADRAVAVGKVLADIVCPIIHTDFLQGDEVTELIERHALVEEDAAHEMMFAAEEAV